MSAAAPSPARAPAPHRAPARVLIFGEELRLRAARRVALSVGCDVAIEEDPAHIITAVAQSRPDVVVFDYDHGGPAALLLAEQVHKAAPAAAMIIVCHPSPPPAIERLLRAPWFVHLLGLESPWFMEELAATLARLGGGPIFGLHRHLPWGPRVVDVEVATSDDKDTIFARIEAFMASLGVRGRLVQRLHAVADEMLMNAVYDAPVDRGGEHRYAALPRTTRVDLAPHERPTLRWGSDGRIFALAISDPFGGLSPRILKTYIAKGLRRGDDQIDRKAGGAGLGLYFLFDSLNSLTLYQEPGRRTEVVGLVDIRGSFRDVLQSPKSLNIFVREARGEIG